MGIITVTVGEEISEPEKTRFKSYPPPVRIGNIQEKSFEVIVFRLKIVLV